MSRRGIPATGNAPVAAAGQAGQGTAPPDPATQAAID